MININYNTIEYIFQDSESSLQRKSEFRARIDDPNFDEIQIHNVYDDKYLKEFFELFPQLKNIEIHGTSSYKKPIDFGIFPSTNKVGYKSVNDNIENISLSLDTRFKDSPEEFEQLKTLKIVTSALTGFPEAPKLESLTIANSSLSTIAPLKHTFPKLTTINLQDNLLTEIKTKGQFPLLKLLNLSNNKIASFSSAPIFPNVRKLELEKNYFNDVASLTKFPKVETIDLTNQNILPKTVSRYRMNPEDLALTNIDAFPKLEFLAKLNLNKNGLTKLPQLDLPSLKELTISENFLTKIDGFESETVEKMSFSNNKLIKIANVHTPSLKRLDIAQNYVKEFENLTAPHLEILEITNNDFESLESLGKLPLLKDIRVQSNSLTTFKTLQETHPDAMINYYDNPIENFYGLSYPIFMRSIKETEKTSYFSPTEQLYQTRYNLHPYATKLYNNCMRKIRSDSNPPEDICKTEYAWLSRSTETEIDKFMAMPRLEEKQHSFAYLISEIRPKNADLLDQSLQKLQKPSDPIQSIIVDTMIMILKERVKDPAFAPISLK